MRLLEELSGIIFKQIARPYLKSFKEKSPEKILRKSFEFIDYDIQDDLREYVRSSIGSSGGFKDRGGKTDIYYTLFGYYLAESLDMTDLFPAISNYTKNEISRNNLTGVHLQCAAILFSKLCKDKAVERSLRDQIRQQLKSKTDKQPAYKAFINLLACYYLNDFRGLYLIKNQLEKLSTDNPLPSPVVAALLVLQSSFGKPVEGLKQNILSFLSQNLPDGSLQVPSGGFRGSDNQMQNNHSDLALHVPHGGSGGPYDSKMDGGFRAVRTAPVSDMLSTAVSLYALRFAGHDLRMIKPGCLDFIDLLYNEGGFSANMIDPDTDIEYTFYGLLAMGSLAD